MRPDDSVQQERKRHNLLERGLRMSGHRREPLGMHLTKTTSLVLPERLCGQRGSGRSRRSRSSLSPFHVNGIGPRDLAPYAPDGSDYDPYQTYIVGFTE